MPIMIVFNSGSSSLRLSAYEYECGAIREVATSSHGRIERDHDRIIEDFLRDNALSDVKVAAHRIVHGGTLSETRLINHETELAIRDASRLAPLHNPIALDWLGAARRILGAGIPQVAVFDTAFFHALPDVAARYALPTRLSDEYGLRRYGFHGIAHQAMWRRYRETGGRGEKVITLQLGSGCSAAAILNGLPMDTSMGFSPLEGLMMATRPGDIDPGLILYLQQTAGLSPAQMETLLNTECGLKGVSGIARDMRALLASDAPSARLAVEMFCYRIRKYIGAYAAVLGGVDAILFGGGIGENAPVVRDNILSPLGWLGVTCDTRSNPATAGATACISKQGSAIEAWVIHVDEGAVIAEETVRLLSQEQG